MGDDTIEIAWWYHQLDMNIVPIRPGSKLPTIKWEKWQYPAQTWNDVASWKWHGRGLACINGVGGWRSLDIDHASSLATLSSLLALLQLPSSYPWVVQSQRGYHIWFLCHDWFPPLPQGNAYIVGHPHDLYAQAFKQLEVRWQECYTILPPTIHPSGHQYAWLYGIPEWKDSLATLDGTFLEEALAQVVSFQEEKPEHITAPPPHPSPTRFSASRKEGDPHKLAEAKFDGVLATLRKKRKGERNRTLHWASCRAGELVGGNYLDEQHAMSALIQAASDTGLKRFEILPVIRIGLTEGGKHPWSPPPQQ